MQNNTKITLYVLFVLFFAGLIDSSYLSYKHFFEPLSTCSIGLFGNCGEVLHSPYSVIFGIPVAVFGIVHYLILSFLIIMAIALDDFLYKRFSFIQTAIGVVFSAYLTFLQVFIIKAMCPYCLLSAVISLSLYILLRTYWIRDYRSFVWAKCEIVYKLFFKPIFFMFSPEWVHEQAMFWGEKSGNVSFVRRLFGQFFYFTDPALKQKIAGISFKNPIGLSAGYDYMASFYRILPAIGFGFETIGTISNEPCEGNEKPRLGRLPKSRSLLVNKGFRNPGADRIIQKLKREYFSFPVGISIGKTNCVETAGTQKKGVEDVVLGFQKFLKSPVRNGYYELNISCPNLKGGVTFYSPKELSVLLNALDKLKIEEPVFVKMPIEKSDKEVRSMLDVISKHKWITGVIFGNLQKDRKDSSFVTQEVRRAGQGNFSGRPTYRRSNELIKLAYKEYGKRFVIIGSGGVFSADDAYRKIRFGATLIQMITGMIFEGPQRISQINEGLVVRLKADGFSHISEAIGADAK